MTTLIGTVVAFVALIALGLNEKRHEEEKSRLRAALWEEGRERRERERREEEAKDIAFRDRLFSEPELAERWYELQEPFMPEHFERRRHGEPFTAFWRRHHDEAAAYWKSRREEREPRVK